MESYDDFLCEMEKLSISEQPQQLPEELIREILSRLPVRSLLKFKSVCKSWHQIISSPCFEESHLQNYCNKPASSSNDDNNNGCLLQHTFDHTMLNWKLSMVFPDGHKPPEESPLDDAGLGPIIIVGGNLASKPKTEVVGPVNGLICLYGKFLKDRIALSNPCLRKTETLSRSPSTISNSRDEVMIEGRLTRSAGLGFDDKDVKVVQVLSYVDCEEGRFDLGMLVDVYSRDTGTWKNLEVGVLKDTYVKVAITTTNNGPFCHWVGMRDSDGTGSGTMVYVLLSLDLRNEVFECTPLPDTVSSEFEEMGTKIFGGIGDSLVLFCWGLHGELSEGGKFLETWVLSGLGEEGCWTRLPGVIGPLSYESAPVGLWKGRELVVMCEREKRFIVYDCYTREIRNIIDNSDDWDWDRDRPKVFEYKGSLVSPCVRM